MKYNRITENDIYPGLEVVFHPTIDSDKNCRETKVLSDVKNIDRDKVVRIMNESGAVLLESLELLSEFKKRAIVA